MSGTARSSKLLFALLVVVLLAALTWTNYQFSLDNPGGNDFLPRWLGTRLFLLDGQSPYSAESTAAIQQLIYNRPANPGEDAALFAYPHYSMLIFAPFAAIGDYPLARAFWMTLLEASALLIAVLSLALVDWRPDRGLMLFFLIFSVTWYHAARTLINGNAALLVALLMVLSLFLIRQGKEGWAGLALALSTIKPQIVLLFVLFLAGWAIFEGRRRFLLAFALSLGGLALASTLIQPDWLAAELQQVRAYPGYAPPGSPIEIFGDWWGPAGFALGLMLAAAVIILLLRSWRRAFGGDWAALFHAACLTLVAANLSGIPTTTANYAAMLPALALILKELHQRRMAKIWAPALLLLFLGGLWLLFLLTLGSGPQFREHSIMFLPAPLILLALLLLWVKPQPTEAGGR